MNSILEFTIIFPWGAVVLLTAAVSLKICDVTEYKQKQNKTMQNEQKLSYVTKGSTICKGGRNWTT